MSANILKQPMVQAVLIGAIAGLVCQQLPGGIRSFVVDDLASPVLSTVLHAMSGIMGPVIFLSLVTAVGALDDIDELNDKGSKIVRRFARIAVRIAMLSIAVGGVLFPVFGEGSMRFEPAMIVGLFSAYGVFVSNACYGLEVAYRLLEQLEAAYVMDAVDRERLSQL